MISEEQVQRDEVVLSDLIRTVWGHRLFVAVGIVLGTAIGALTAYLTPIAYRAQVLLLPSEPDNATGASGLGAQLSGISALAGISLGEGSNKSVETIATLKSRALIESFISSENLMPVLFSSQWDSANQDWKSEVKKPTPWKAVNLFLDDVLNVTEDKASGLVILTVEWGSPVEAARWAAGLVKRTNETLRSRATARAERNLAYLNGQLGANNIIEVRQSIYRLIESEIKTAMLAQGNDEFGLKTIDPPVVPDTPVRPKVLIIVALGFTIGAIASALLVLMLYGAPRQPV